MSCFIFFHLLELFSFGELDIFDESEKYVSGSVSSGKFVGSANDVGFGDLVTTGIDSIGDVFCWLCFYQEESIPNMVDS